MSFNFAKNVEKVFQAIVMRYQLRVLTVTSTEVLLLGDNYALAISLDRDGPQCLYVDTMANPYRAYNPLLFLLNKRRDRLQFSASKADPCQFEEFMKEQLEALESHLSRAGDDILSGDKRWLRSYSWPTVEPEPEIITAINLIY